MGMIYALKIGYKIFNFKTCWKYLKILVVMNKIQNNEIIRGKDVGELNMVVNHTSYIEWSLWNKFGMSTMETMW